MTKKTAVDRLMECFNAGPKWGEFFENKVEKLNGDDKIVTESTFGNILRYFSKLI